MSQFKVALHIVPRRGLLDPQGKAVADALQTLGFKSVKDVHVGRHVIVELSAMCEKLLANPVTEDFEVAGVSTA
jgi:phosphoribosylformylglycinamidine synthase